MKKKLKKKKLVPSYLEGGTTLAYQDGDPILAAKLKKEQTEKLIAEKLAGRSSSGFLDNVGSAIQDVGAGVIDYNLSALGMNDAASTTGLAANTGYTKTGLKNIVNKYLLFNPSGKVVINNITQTDKTPNVTNAPSYRTEIAAAVTEMQASSLPVYLAPTDTSYLSSVAANYVATEQTAGSRLHPSEIGQLAMANTIWTVCQNLI